MKPQIESYVSENTGERVVVYDRGIRIIISDIRGLPGTARQWNSLETVELAADRVVVWTKEQFLTTLGNMKQPENIPLEIYMEGNLVFREGERVIRADATNSSRFPIPIACEFHQPVPHAAPW